MNESEREIEEVRLRARRDPWGENERVRRARLREAGSRSLGENLAEGLALSDFLSTFAGSLRRAGSLPKS